MEANYVDSVAVMQATKGFCGIGLLVAGQNSSVLENLL
jgi:hypothetical protein